MNIESRLQRRQANILSRSYLVYRSLWPLIEDAIQNAISSCPNPISPLVLDVGCGERPYADLFQKTQYIGLNYSTVAASPDIVGDAQALPLKNDSFDIVFSTQVIEHVPEPKILVSEALRVLKPGGIFVLTGPFYWPLHEEPYDFYRFTKYGFKHLLITSGFDFKSIRGDAKSLTQAAVAVIECLPRWLIFMVPIINLIAPKLQKLSQNETSTLNYVVIGRKP
jgi:SAM-dependent methyltransferase